MLYIGEIHPALGTNCDLELHSTFNIHCVIRNDENFPVSVQLWTNIPDDEHGSAWHAVNLDHIEEEETKYPFAAYQTELACSKIGHYEFTLRIAKSEHDFVWAGGFDNNCYISITESEETPPVPDDPLSPMKERREKILEEEIKPDHTKEIHEKSAKTIEAIRNALQRHFLFTSTTVIDDQGNDYQPSIDFKAIDDVIDSMYPIECPEGTVMIKEGDLSGKFSFIESGTFAVTQYGEHLRNVEAGEIFGEYALISDCAMKATLTAVSDSKVWAVDRHECRQRLATSAHKDLMERTHFLNRLPLFRKMTGVQIVKAASMMIPKEFSAGTTLHKSGHPGTHISIIQSGRAHVCFENPCDYDTLADPEVESPLHTEEVKSTSPPSSFSLEGMLLPVGGEDSPSSIHSSYSAKPRLSLSALDDGELLHGAPRSRCCCEMGPGEIIGENSMIMNPPIWRCTTTSLTDVTVLQLKRNQFKDAFRPIMRNLKNRVKESILRRVPLFQLLSSEQIHCLARRAVHVSFKKGETATLNTECPRRNGIFVVDHGDGVLKTERGLTRLGKGQYFGLWTLLQHFISVKSTSETGVLSPIQSPLLSPLASPVKRPGHLLLPPKPQPKRVFTAETPVSCVYIHMSSFSHFFNGELLMEIATRLGLVPRGPFIFSPKSRGLEIDSTPDCSDIECITPVASRPNGHPLQHVPMAPEAITPMSVLGVGTYGEVYLAQYTAKQSQYAVALKCLPKQKIIENKQVRNIFSEKQILSKVHHPFIQHLFGTFQSATHLHMVTEFLAGGELWRVMYGRNRPFAPSAYGGLPIDVARFYTANVILALEYLHSRGIMYRDIKPENLVLNEKGYLKLIDFGFAKLITAERPRYYTLCGTAEYVAPEVIRPTPNVPGSQTAGHDQSVDLWSLGILCYEMFFKRTPFEDQSQQGTFQRILKSNKYLRFPRSFDNDARLLIRGLLRPRPNERLGAFPNGFTPLKEHPFFTKVNFDWVALQTQQMPAPHVPTLDDPFDSSHFDSYNAKMKEMNLTPSQNDETELSRLFDGY
eukprot:TRINITY_DN4767_c0_g1_i1.p1 TRINITY_DN4767_c0_g1~~TRINITY_DN4767_c0_g1_i1.p1  ORF type:complete len:1041 (-),score=292.86 TRINITY_DN4767_c0_g1_i1:1478-4600(-)